MHTHRLLAGPLLLFIALSAADLGLTWLLVEGTAGEVYESNPLADWFLDRYGWAGLAGFKAATVLLVVGACAAVARHRPRLARGVSRVACLAPTLVVGYSSYLAAFGEVPLVGGERAQLSELQAERQRLEAVLRRNNVYRRFLEQLCADVAAGRCGLEEAVGRVAGTEKARDADWLRALHSYYPGRSPEECFATHVINATAGMLRREPDEARRVARALAAEYRSLFGRPVPVPFHERTPASEAGGEAPRPPQGLHGNRLHLPGGRGEWGAGAI